MSDAPHSALTPKFRCYLYRNKQTVDIPVQTITLSQTVNELPSATMTVGLNKHPGGDVRIQMGDLLNWTQVLQTYLTKQLRLTSDLVVQLEDPYGNPLNFQGFLAKPSVNLSEGQLGITLSAVHRMAAMQAFCGGIYSARDMYSYTDGTKMDQDLTEEFFPPGANPDSIAMRILAQWRKFKTVYERQDPTYRKSLDMVHQINKDAMLNFIQPMLEASERYSIIPFSGKPSFSGSPLNIPQINLAVARTLINGLNFWDALPTILSMFKLQFRPDWNGTGILEIIRTQDDPAGRFIQASPEAINLEVFATYELPLGRVYVRGRAAPFFTFDNAGTSTAGADAVVNTQGEAGRAAIDQPESIEELLNRPDIIAWPANGPTVKGTTAFYVVDGPEWLGPEAVQNEHAHDQLDQSNLSFAGCAKARKATLDMLGGQRVTRETIMRWIAKYEYDEHYLKYTAANVSLPFTASITAGRTYEVRDLKGNPLFIGFLDTVRHSLSADSENAAARTTCNFTHVRFPSKVQDTLADPSLTLLSALTNLKTLK